MKNETTNKLLQELVNIQKDQLIVQLGLAGLTQRQIREVVGVDIRRVNKIMKHLKGVGTDKSFTM